MRTGLAILLSFVCLVGGIYFTYSEMQPFIKLSYACGKMVGARGVMIALAPSISDVIKTPLHVPAPPPPQCAIFSYGDD